MSTGPASRDSLLTTTILSQTPLTYSINIALYNYLTNDASDLALLLSTHKEVYFSRFKYYTHRLTMFLRAITPHALSTSIAQVSSSSGARSKSKGASFIAGAKTILPVPETFTTNLIMPLFESACSSADGSHFFCSTEFLDLITAVLELYIPQALNSKASLRPLSSMLEYILYVPDGTHGIGLFERLISSNAGGKVLRMLMASKSTVAKVFNAELLEFYIYRVTSLVESCLVSHGASVKDALSDWVEIVATKSALEGFEKELETHNLQTTCITGDPMRVSKRQVKAENHLPDLSKMRALKPKSTADLRSQNSFSALVMGGLNDERSIIFPPQSQVIGIPRPQLDERSLFTLRRLIGSNAKSPQSIPDVHESLKTLKTLITFQTLAKIFESFPCASCSKVCSGDVLRGKGSYDVKPAIKFPERNNVGNITVTTEVAHHVGGDKTDQENAKEGRDGQCKGKGKGKVKKPGKLRKIENLGKEKIPSELLEDRKTSNILRSEPVNPKANNYGPSSMFSQVPGPWRVILSAQAMKDLIDTGQDGTFPIAERILKELATGYWNRRSPTRPRAAMVELGTSGFDSTAPVNVASGRGVGRKDVKGGNEPEWVIEKWQGNYDERAVLKLYKAVSGKDFEILWSIEGALDELNGGWRQAIKIWMIGGHKEILESIPIVLKTHRGYDNSYIRGCMLRQLEEGTGKSLRHLPAKFVLGEDPVKRERFGATGTITKGNKLSKEESLGLHEALTTRKVYTLNEKMFESIQASKKCGVTPEFPFDVSEEETDIVRWWRSSVLVVGRSGTGKTTCLVFKLLAGYLTRTGAGLEPRQIFLTRSPILAGKIARYVRRLIDSQLGRFDNTLLEAEQNDSGAHLIRENSNNDHDSADKNLFSIGKDDWPLVCTFDEFCGLLENTLKITDRTDFAPANTAEIRLSWEHRRVDFAKFKRTYWPSLPVHLRREISVELVFAELMAVIKGGNYASDFHPLTKSSYLKLSSRLAPTFLEDSRERENIWRIYELYEDRRRTLDEWDDLDRCRGIRMGLIRDRELLERLKAVIGECYVDEVQDLRIGEVEILLRVVGDPRRIHLAGDTAQCISRDSTFRFQDVKALFFHIFGSTVAKGESEPSKTAEAGLEKPKLFLLARNYRSHQGILALASSVVDLLWKVFPDTIDKLQPEVGHHLGPKPKLFIGFSSGLFSNKLFGAVDIAENIAEFGAEQVILVRDDEARKTLRGEIGTVNLILTIVESKGMEFDDVLLFNYFSGSPAGPSFRALVSMEEMEGAGLVGFDRRKHAVLSAELRGLYVAITRTRARLWLIEEHDKNVTAMARLWSKYSDDGLVDVVLRGDKNKNAADMMKEMRQGKSNKPADWYRKGLEFLEKKLWHPALKCFESAGDTVGQKLSKAHILEQKAIDLSYEQPTEAKSLFKEAGVLFLGSKHPKQASKCFTTILDWKSAAEVWSGSDHERAAGYYERAGLFKEAAGQHHIYGNFEKAAAAYSQGQYFVDLLQYLTDHGYKMKPLKFRKFARLVNILFRSQKDARKDLKLMAITLLGSDSEKEAFLVQYDMTSELIQHYLTTKQFMKAVNKCLNLGDYTRATQIIEYGAFGTDLNADLVDEIFAWTETRRLQGLVSDFLGYMNGDIKKSRSSILTPPIAFATEETKKSWGILERSVMGRFRERRVSEDETKWNVMDKDLQLTADLLITANGDYFGAKCDPREFPFQSLVRCTEALKKANKDGYFPVAVGRFYGISYIKEDPSNVWVLPPSPLLPDGMSVVMTYNEAFQGLNKQLSDDMGKSIYSLLDNTTKVLKNEALCEEFIIRGSCPLQAEGSCHSTHASLSRDVSLSRLELLNSSLEILLCLKFPFRQKLFGNAGYARRYRGTVRHWLEQLLVTTTFVSEFTTHPLINIGSLYSNPGESERGVRSALEELLYHRITRWSVNDIPFSQLLQQVDLADTLNIGEEFGRKIISRVDWGRLNPIKEKPFHSFWDILRLRSALKEGDLCHVMELMLHIHPLQLNLDSQETECFHALIGFWEQCCAFLIVIASPDEFLIKDNWRKIHLKYFSPCLAGFDALSLVERGQNAETAKSILAGIVQHVLESFQKIQSCSYATLLMTWNKRPDILIRRVLDLLAICLCNMQHSTGNKVRPALDNKCIWDIIKEWNFWCRRKTVHAQESELDINRFMVIFADAFNSSYSGIESLALYQKVNLRQPFSKFRFMQPSWKVKRDQFQSLSSFNKRPNEQGHPKGKIPNSHGGIENGYTASGAQGALTEAEIKAVSTIQSFWRHYWQLLSEKRKFDKTPEGKAIKLIDHQFQMALNTMDKALPSKTLRWTIFRDQGVHVVLEIQETELIIEEALSKTIMRMKTGKDLEWTERGALDDVYQSLCQAKDNMAALKESVFDRNVVACPVEKLGHTLTEFRGIAMGLSKAVGDIRMEITRIEVQVAGRRASTSVSLKTPGEKRLG